MMNDQLPVKEWISEAFWIVSFYGLGLCQSVIKNPPAIRKVCCEILHRVRVPRV